MGPRAAELRVLLAQRKWLERKIIKFEGEPMEKRRFVMAMLVITMVCSVAQGVDLAPGGNVALWGTTVAADPNLAGVVQEDPIIPFGHRRAFRGRLQGRVVMSDNLGTMIFSPRVRDFNDLDDSGWQLVGIGIRGYRGWSTDVDYRTDGLGDIGPGSAMRSVNGDVVMFDFHADPVGDGNETYFVFALTDAPAYVPVEDGIRLLFANSERMAVAITLPYFVPAVPVDIDIKPGSCPNPFNAKSKGSVPVAIVGSDVLCVNTIDPESIALISPSGNAVPALLKHHGIEDSTEPHDGDPNDCHDCFDCDLRNITVESAVPGTDMILDSYCGDGYLDLVVKFDTQALAAAIGSVRRDSCVVLTLYGLTKSGIAITGSDSVLTKAK
jgi:hypothetical protein